MFRVGLTGGIASGKTTISNLFEKLKIPVIDTDIISHQLMQPGQTGYNQTVDHFGQNILSNDKTINRVELREIVFNNPEEKLWLENMLHPLIRAKAIQLMEQADNSSYVLLVVPLMFETQFNTMVDHVIAIDCPFETQKKRLIKREHVKNPSQNNFTESMAEKIIASQLSNDERIKLSDSILNNNDNVDRFSEVNQLHEYLLSLSKQKQH